MPFTKMEGLGNDYVYINGFEVQVAEDFKKELAVKLSDRHFGVGSDGLIFINPSEQADFEMEMYNADGTRAEMCGNGIRCVARYVYDHRMTDKTDFTIESMGAVKQMHLCVEGEEVTAVEVNMGSPILEAEKIPVLSSVSPVIAQPIEVGGLLYEMTCVSMGNPHCVVFVEDVKNLPLEKIGPLFEHHELFPNRVNTEFVQVVDRETVKMRVWERGTGETLACGTGACATAVA
ncbi:MAG: diaminopimelate epimerase, partial [Lachnospiraceae bacterium]|nr:diaminopimelate epimerase [Lachnospiraceae bacterium]